MISEKEAIDKLVQEHLDIGQYVLFESDTYRQHLLREHPNVCRQTNRYSPQYKLHTEPCGCPPSEVQPSTDPFLNVLKGKCCWTVQPVGSACYMCDEIVAVEEMLQSA